VTWSAAMLKYSFATSLIELRKIYQLGIPLPRKSQRITGRPALQPESILEEHSWERHLIRHLTEVEISFLMALSNEPSSNEALEQIWSPQNVSKDRLRNAMHNLDSLFLRNRRVRNTHVTDGILRRHILQFDGMCLRKQSCRRWARCDTSRSRQDAP